MRPPGCDRCHSSPFPTINNTRGRQSRAPTYPLSKSKDTTYRCHGLAEKQQQQQRHGSGGGERGRRDGVRPAGHGAARLHRRAHVGGLRPWPRRRRTQRALLPLRHAARRAGAERPVRRSGRRPPRQRRPAHRRLPVGSAIPARRRRPRGRRVQEREEPGRRVPHLAEKRRCAASSLPPSVTH